METLVEAVDHHELVSRLNLRSGEESRPSVIEVDKSLIRKFAMAIGDPNPLYSDEGYARATRFGGIVAPPTFVSALMNGHWPDVVVQGLPFGKELHSSDNLVLDRDIRPGDVLTCKARFKHAWLRQSPRGVRLMQSAEFLAHDQNGDRVAYVELLSVAF